MLCGNVAELLLSRFRGDVAGVNLRLDFVVGHVLEFRKVRRGNHCGNVLGGGVVGVVETAANVGQLIRA